MVELRGTIEIGALSASHLFGERGGMLMSAMLCLVLLSTISAMVLAGPRVLSSRGMDRIGCLPLTGCAVGRLDRRGAATA